MAESTADANGKVTRLAHGLPVGGELDYLEEGTLAAAIRQWTVGRKTFASAKLERGAHD
jgi:recombination protein RecR